MTHQQCLSLQAVESLEVLEEAIQAAALEADFTFPDDTSSSHGDQSLVIDDIIESLEIDAMEAEQEALLVQRAEEEAQVSYHAFLLHDICRFCLYLASAVQA